MKKFNPYDPRAVRNHLLSYKRSKPTTDVTTDIDAVDQAVEDWSSSDDLSPKAKQALLKSKVKYPDLSQASTDDLLAELEKRCN